eukprot:GCRY01002673.1.p1 GENE.GCRY01002673.1~~GCRY01002673.1.p1  ORF type:complete len:393 (-),score=92.89 GCRY01002673.1:48-1226(-)
MVKRKRQEISVSDKSEGGDIPLVIGQNDMGQLGLGEDYDTRKRPTLIKELQGKNIKGVVAGGLHTAFVLSNGDVYSCGCNDEGALGWKCKKEDEEYYVPGKIDGLKDVVSVSCGDSHSTALTHEGELFGWGLFRDSAGPVGFTPKITGKQFTPIPLMSEITLVRSGENHCLALTADNRVLSWGVGEAGRLGRCGMRFSERTKLTLLDPKPLRFRSRPVIVDLACGACHSFAITAEGDVYGWGLNNWAQLGLGHTDAVPTPTLIPSLKNIKKIDAGDFHSLALTNDGKVYSWGRGYYGILGLGDDKERAVPTLIASLSDKHIVDIACGGFVCFAVTKTGQVYAWGMGSNLQLAAGDDDEDINTPQLMKGKQLENRRVVAIDGGAQHTVLLAKE